MRLAQFIPALLTLALAGAPATAAERLTSDAAVELYKKGERLHSWKADLVMQYNIAQTLDGQKVVREALSYERNPGRYFAMIFTQPKSEYGQGYLRIDQTLWFYDASSGRWERRTQRERLGGNNVHESDLVGVWLDDYTVAHVGDEKVGSLECRVFELRAKPGREVAYPLVKSWVSGKDLLEVKRQEFAASGKLLRTAYAGQHKKVMNPFIKREVFLRGQIVIYDEVVKGSVTTVTLKGYEFKPHPQNVFTKAWLEGKSR